MTTNLTDIDILDRMVESVRRVQRRLVQATSALDDAGISYAVSGDHAVAFWVSSIDESAVRNTPEVELLVERRDYHRVVQVFGTVEFVPIDLTHFSDTSSSLRRPAAQLIFAEERTNPSDLVHSPSIEERLRGPKFFVLTLDAVVHMNLSAFRSLHRLRLRDLIDVDLIDASWVSRFPNELAARLQQLFDTPEG